MLSNSGVIAKKHLQHLIQTWILTTLTGFNGSYSFIYQYFLKFSTNMSSLLKYELRLAKPAVMHLSHKKFNDKN